MYIFTKGLNKIRSIPINPDTDGVSGTSSKSKEDIEFEKRLAAGDVTGPEYVEYLRRHGLM